MKLGEAFIQLGFNVDDTALKAFNDKVDDLEASLFKVSGTAAAALYGIDRFIDSVSHNSIALRDLSIQTGLSTQGLQEWAVAAHLADTAFSTEQAEAGIKSLQGHLAELHNFGTGALPFSRLLGVDARNLNAFQALQILHDRMPYLMSHADEFGGQAGIAGLMQQIGLGDQWLNLLQQTEVQYQKTHQAAQDYMLTGDQQKNLVAMDFAAEQLRMRLGLLAEQFGAAFSPQIISAMQKIPLLLTNFATGLKAIEVPLGIIIAGFTLLISPWIPFLVVLYEVLAVIEIIGAKMNAKGDNWVKSLVKDFQDLNWWLDKVVNSIKFILNPGGSIADYVVDKVKGIDFKGAVKNANAQIGQQNEKDYTTIHNFMKWFEGLDTTSLVAQQNRAFAPVSTVSNNSNAQTIAPTINIHTDDVKKGTDAAADYTHQISKANDFFGNHE